jgi:hypothetical protein
MAALGIWFGLRGWEQYKTPADIRRLGMGWYLALIKSMMPERDRYKIDQMFAQTRVIRFFAVASLVGGIGMFATFVIAILLSII